MGMKILVDTNVILDVLLDRTPFSEPAARLFALIENSAVEAFSLRDNGYNSGLSVKPVAVPF
jgi:predicted nucleic acid-binding protein